MTERARLTGHVMTSGVRWRDSHAKMEKKGIGNTLTLEDQFLIRKAKTGQRGDAAAPTVACMLIKSGPYVHCMIADCLYKHRNDVPKSNLFSPLPPY